MTSFPRRAVLLGAAALAVGSRMQPATAETAAPDARLSYPFVLPPLPYAATANEPSIDAETMDLHHGKHHASYVANLNAALKDHPDLHGVALHDLLARLKDMPEAIRTTVRNNAGGHANHTMFWQVIGGKGGEPGGELGGVIARDFGSIGALKAAFDKSAAGVFGSGWAFVTADRAGQLALVTRPNQDTPLMEGERVLFGNDVWEHAYYLKYRNRRPDYLAAWWAVLDWPRIEARYAAVRTGTLNI